MIAPGRVLRDVRRNLREVVLPDLGDPQARAVLAAALGILDEVAGRVRVDEEPARLTAAELGPHVSRWAEALRDVAPETAAVVAACGDRAATAATPIEARAIVLEAAERAVESAWKELEPERRDSLLAELRPLLRADVERQKGKQ